MSLWQQEKWGEMLLKSFQAEKILKLGNYYIEKRKIGLGKFGLFMMGIDDFKELQDLEKELIKLCKKEKCVFLQIEDYNLDGKHSKSKSFKYFKKGYYKKFITPYTAIINLNLSKDDILAKMKPKGRYNIRLAEKKGIKVKIVEKNDENIKIFCDLMAETTKRDKFHGNTFYYYNLFLSKINTSELIIAYCDKIPIAAGIFVFEKDVSIYYYGASTDKKEYRNMMAPYLLQWTAITHAKEIGSKFYDFLGIASPDDNNSSLAGVTDFKLKLTPTSVKVSNSLIFVNKKFSYNLMKLMHKVKRILR